jgi:hypothetical protein
MEIILNGAVVVQSEITLSQNLPGETVENQETPKGDSGSPRQNLNPGLSETGIGAAFTRAMFSAFLYVKQ